MERVIWEKSLDRLRVHGIVCKAPEEVSVKGSRHTLSLTIDKPVTIKKSKWLKHHVDRLKRASVDKETPIILVSIDDEEYCVAVLRQYGVDVKGRTQTRLPGKLEVEKRTKALREFFREALQALRVIWEKERSPIVVIGPGFIKNDFVKYVKRITTEIAENILDVKGVNSTGVAGVYEAIRSGILTKTSKHLRIVEENRNVEEILVRLGKGRLDVTYGVDEVKKADLLGAIEKLFLVDTIFRKSSDDQRLFFEILMKEVEEKGGRVIIISSEYEAGKKLLGLGGVAALLRFPIYSAKTIS